MNLKEMLSTPEAKKMYRELAQEFHPDKGGSSSIMKKVNAAKSDGDAELIRIYNKLKKISKKPPFPGKKYSDIKKKPPFPGTMDMFFKISTWAAVVEELLNKEAKIYKFTLVARKSGDEINISVHVMNKKVLVKYFMVFNAQEHAKNIEMFVEWLPDAILANLKKS